MNRSLLITESSVRELHSQNLSTTNISKRLKSSIGEVRKVLLVLGLQENKYIRKIKDYKDIRQDVKILYESGVSKKQIAKKLKTHFDAINRVIKNENLIYENPKFIGKKKCSKCKEVLEYSKFGISRQFKDGYKTVCKSCRKIHEKSRKEYCRNWAKENKLKKSQIDKEYRIKNYLKLKDYKASDRYKAIKRKSDKKLYEKNTKDPIKKLSMRLRSMLSSFKKYKNDKTFNYLGYTSNDLVNHLQSKFKDGMSWDNYGRGGWHIDHIKPIAAFDFSEEDWLKKAFSLNNLQPLFESENCSKGSFYNGKRHIFDGKSTKK
jgi:hypothetical protein